MGMLFWMWCTYSTSFNLDYLMHKGLHWDDVTKKVYPWDELIKLLRERDDNTIGVFKKEK